MTEQSLHEQLKEFYAQDAGVIESPYGDYRVDVLKEDLLIEIQTGSFSTIRDKLRDLVRDNRVKLVYPIPYNKWIIKLSGNDEQLSKRKSPKRGRIEDVFYELVYIPKLLLNPNFNLEIIFIDLEEYWINDGKGSWRRKRWSIKNKKMIKIHDRILIHCPEEFKKLIPYTLSSEFTSISFAKKARLNKRLAQKMLYCLTKMKIVERTGKRGRSYLYSMC